MIKGAIRSKTLFNPRCAALALLLWGALAWSAAPGFAEETAETSDSLRLRAAEARVLEASARSAWLEAKLREEIARRELAEAVAQRALVETEAAQSEAQRIAERLREKELLVEFLRLSAELRRSRLSGEDAEQELDAAAWAEMGDMQARAGRSEAAALAFEEAAALAGRSLLDETTDLEQVLAIRRTSLEEAARSWAQTGDAERAFAVLKALLAEGGADLAALRADPVLASLPDFEARFAALAPREKAVEPASDSWPPVQPVGALRLLAQSAQPLPDPATVEGVVSQVAKGDPPVFILQDASAALEVLGASGMALPETEWRVRALIALSASPDAAPRWTLAEPLEILNRDAPRLVPLPIAPGFCSPALEGMLVQAEGVVASIPSKTEGASEGLVLEMSEGGRLGLLLPDQNALTLAPGALGKVQGLLRRLDAGAASAMGTGWAIQPRGASDWMPLEDAEASAAAPESSPTTTPTP
jgi:hypothetical protein